METSSNEISKIESIMLQCLIVGSATKPEEANKKIVYMEEKRSLWNIQGKVLTITYINFISFSFTVSKFSSGLLQNCRNLNIKLFFFKKNVVAENQVTRR